MSELDAGDDEGVKESVIVVSTSFDLVCPFANGNFLTEKIPRTFLDVFPSW
jgi:hypothetical protein